MDLRESECLSDFGSGALANRCRPANGQGPAGEKLSVERADCIFGLGVFFEFHETKASGPAGRAVLDDFYYACFEALRKEPLRESFFRLRVWDVPDKQSIQSDLRCDLTMTTPKERCYRPLSDPL